MSSRISLLARLKVRIGFCLAVSFNTEGRYYFCFVFLSGLLLGWERRLKIRLWPVMSLLWAVLDGFSPF